MSATRGPRNDGFTLVELMVAMTLFLIFSGIVLSGIMAMSRGLDQTRETSDISAEARVALERISREIRQADALTGISSTSATVKVDFDGDADPHYHGSLSDPEVLTYSYDSGAHSLVMTARDSDLAAASTVTEALLAGEVQALTFTYTSSDWSKDGNHDGTVSWAEAGTDGIDHIAISLRVGTAAHSDEFRTEVTLRNRSQS